MNILIYDLDPKDIQTDVEYIEKIIARQKKKKNDFMYTSCAFH